MPKLNRQFGDWGEELAARFLRKRHYEILERNYQKRCGEIDIVARKEGALHFVEVKTRSESGIRRFGQPEEAVGRTKQRKLLTTAHEYLFEHAMPENISWQIDVISIIYSPQGTKATIRWFAAVVEESILT